MSKCSTANNQHLLQITRHFLSQKTEHPISLIIQTVLKWTVHKSSWLFTRQQQLLAQQRSNSQQSNVSQTFFVIPSNCFPFSPRKANKPGFLAWLNDWLVTVPPLKRLVFLQTLLTVVIRENKTHIRHALLVLISPQPSCILKDSKKLSWLSPPPSP